jgi:hypothetical protein
MGPSAARLRAQSTEGASNTVDPRSCPCRVVGCSSGKEHDDL